MSKVIILNGKYKVVGLLGCWVQSKETVTVNEGDVRFIGGMLMYAYRVERASFFNFTDGRDTVNWVTAKEKHNNMESIREWIAKL